MAINGYDIASYQKGIDCSKIAASFVIVKATQGTTYVNPCMKAQVESALKAGKLIGLYHYASKGGADAEADFFVKTATPYIGKAILVLDWESAENVNFKNPEYAMQFLKCVEDKTGVVPFIYMSKSVCREYNWSRIASKNPLWVAQYADYKPTGYKPVPWTDNKGYGAWKTPLIFQYTSTGRLNGWNGNLDLDKAYMSEALWKEYATASKKTESGRYKVNEYTLTDVKYGEGSEQVKFMQQLLNAKGYDCGSADGIFGAQTARALALFQADNKLTACGKGTWNKLLTR